MFYGTHCKSFIADLIYKILRWAAYVACMGKMRNSYKILVRNLKGDHEEEVV
jgi:hypothetical protein